MNIKGIHKTSLIDYPGKISSVLFTGGCNLRCGYCHNADLVCNNCNLQSYSNADALEFIKKRRGLLDGITISGGEPTLAANIDEFIQRIKDLGLSVKIDTNGLNPTVIERLIGNGLLDYVAVDIKTSREKYQVLTGRRVDYNALIKTVTIIRDSQVDYELRTTCIPYYVEMEDFKSIKQSIGRVGKYYLQQFDNMHTLDKTFHDFDPYTPDTLLRFKSYVMTFADECEIRGI